jgi:tRNA nucleotidyltransferase (CCA-adding enzyme)
MIDTVSWQVQNHMLPFIYEKENATLSGTAIRRLIRKIGSENIHMTMLINYYDQCGKSINFNPGKWERLNTRIEEILQEEPILNIKALKVNGDDLIRLGVKPGPIFKVLLEHVLEGVIADPLVNQVDLLEDLVRRISVS